MGDGLIYGTAVTRLEIDVPKTLDELFGGIQCSRSGLGHFLLQNNN